MHKQHQEYFESIKGEMRKCYDDSKPQTEHLMKQLFRRMTAASVDEATTSSSSRSNEEEEDATSQSRSPESGGGHDENNNSRDATEVAAQNGGELSHSMLFSIFTLEFSHAETPQFFNTQIRKKWLRSSEMKVQFKRI